MKSLEPDWEPYFTTQQECHCHSHNDDINLHFVSKKHTQCQPPSARLFYALISIEKRRTLAIEPREPNQMLW